MLDNGDKVLVIARRIYDGDRMRHFVGEVQESSGAVMKVSGYAFVQDNFTSEIVRRDDVRTRIFSLIDALNIIMILPKEIVVENIRFEINNRNQRVVTDQESFNMNLSEFWVTN